MAKDPTDTRLTLLENQIEKVRSLYEKYFAGVQKKQPLKEHEQLKSSFNSISAADLKMTASRFRFESIKNRYVQLNNLWSKTLRQIEEGTYKHHLFLLHAKEAREPAGMKSPAKNIPSTESKKSTPFDVLYEKWKEMASPQQKIPSKEAFVATIQKQIKQQKEKNPEAKIDLKLHREASGQVQIKIQLKKSDAAK